MTHHTTWEERFKERFTIQDGSDEVKKISPSKMGGSGVIDLVNAKEVLAFMQEEIDLATCYIDHAELERQAEQRGRDMAVDKIKARLSLGHIIPDELPDVLHILETARTANSSTV